ncbi:hypothetical protein O3M35_005141 [Rhynocoris fuscipes]|uniref:Uncharacterized protein n=1 Tax=Rhynocoris fuscipes TaxID=488301 RepID=A0AAW1DJU5_9HEMI
MKEERLPRRLLYGRTGDARQRGRLSKRWLDELLEELRKNGVRRWRKKAPR